MSDLNGMKDICQYVKMSAVTILTWIRQEQFPAKKLGGIWISDTDLVDHWRKEYIKGSIDSANKSANSMQIKNNRKQKSSSWSRRLSLLSSLFL